MSAIESVKSRSASFRSALLRGLALSISLVLLAGVLGGLYGWYRDRLAQAQAVILLNPLDGNPFSTSGRGDSLTNLETEAQLVRSFDVAELVVQKTGIDATPAQLIANLDVNPPTNTQLLEITYSDADRARAVVVAQAFADQFLASRETRARALVDGQISLINQQIEDRKTEQAQLSRDLAAAKSTGQAAVIQTQLDAVTTQINQLRARSAELQISSFNPGQVVTPAKLHSEGLLDSWIAFALAGMLVGAVLALLIAFIRSRMDNRVHHVDDVLMTGRSFLGEIDAADAAIIETAPEWARLPDSFRSLRVAILTAEHRRPVVILIAPGSNDPVQRPVSAVGMAVSMAAAGLSTTVIDTLALWPVAEGIERSSLVALLTGGDDPRDALIQVSENLQVISVSREDDGADLFMAPAMARFVERLKQASDIVLVIGGGIGDSSSLALGDRTDAVITEVIQGQSRTTDALLPPSLVGRDLGVIMISGAARRPGRFRRNASVPATIPADGDEPSADEPAEDLEDGTEASVADEVSTDEAEAANDEVEDAGDPDADEAEGASDSDADERDGESGEDPPVEVDATEDDAPEQAADHPTEADSEARQGSDHGEEATPPRKNRRRYRRRPGVSDAHAAQHEAPVEPVDGDRDDGASGLLQESAHSGNPA